MESKLARKIEGATQSQSIASYVREHKSKLEALLPAVGITPERMVETLLTCVQANPTLGQCTNSSLFACMVQAAQYGLNPSVGECYFIPRRNRQKGVSECTFQLGYKGLLALAQRSGNISNIYAREIYANDKFTYKLGLDVVLEHEPVFNVDKGEIIGAYAVCTLKDGSKIFDVMDKSELEARRTASATVSGDSPWNKWYAEMAKKTVLKRLCKNLPLSSDDKGLFDVNKVISKDDAVLDFDDAGLSIDNAISAEFGNDTEEKGETMLEKMARETYTIEE